MKHTKFFATCFLAFLLVIFTGCKDKIMGYSVLLWNVPEYSLQSGQIVPVYIRSNISHVYVIGLQDGTKGEIPLWQLTDPVKRRKIGDYVKKYAEYSTTYASVKLDGLPCRAEPVNTAKQVYRLRKGEVIKILYKGKGQAVMAGKNALEGDWFRILTSNGTFGWCFSYNLNLYETDAQGKQIGEQVIEEEQKNDDIFDYMASNTWYPESFKNMIDSGNIDISRIHPSYNFRLDTENNKVYLNTYEIHQNWTYTGYTKTDDNRYELNDIPIQLIYKNQRFVVVRYTGESGKPEELNFVLLSQDLTEVINAEKDRRSYAYLQVWTHGPVYKSSNYGTITLNEDGSFKWTNFKLLVPSIIDGGTKNYGTVGVKYAVSKSLAANYDGVITFKFEGMSKEVNFLYKVEDGNLRLEDATAARFNGNLCVQRGPSPLILFFRKS